MTYASPTPPPASAARRLWTLLRAQLLLAGGLFAFALYGFAAFTSGQDDTFARLAFEEHLWTVIACQLRVVPAYLLVALAYTAIAFPFLRGTRALRDVARKRGRLRRTRLLAAVAAADFGIYVLSLGPFFRQSPGLLDGMARKLSPVAPDVDLYALYRWHLLDIAAVGFAALVLYAAFYYGRAWLRWVRAASPRGRLLSAAPLPVLGLVIGVGAVQSAPPAPGKTPLNVLIIASDSLRYDHLGVHGYPRRDISPHIDAFAAEAADLQQLHVATASTLESWMTFLSGRFPPTHGVRYMYINRELAESAAKTPDLLPRQLRDAGYFTTVVSNWAGNCFKLVDMGFEHNHASDTQNFDSFIMEATIWSHLVFPLYFSNPVGETLLPEVRRTTGYLRPWALAEKMFGEIDEAGRREQPFFGLLFFSTTHLPYTASYPFNVKYIDPAYDGPHRYQIDVSVHELITSGFQPDLPDEVIEHIRDLYDGTVSEFDHYVGRVLAELKRRGLYDRTIVIITSDHGEDLYDPGSTLGHGTNFFGGDQSTRIPFFIRVPGVTSPGRAVKAVARNADFAPTMLELLNLPIPESHEGHSLAPLLRGESDDLDLPAFGETCYLFFPKDKALVGLTDAERANLRQVEGASETLRVDPQFNNNLVLRRELHDDVIAAKDRMIRTRRWKLVHVPGKSEPIYRLYDLRADPGQTRDLSGEGLPVMETLIETLDRYWNGEAGRLRWPIEWESR